MAEALAEASSHPEGQVAGAEGLVVVGLADAEGLVAWAVREDLVAEGSAVEEVMSAVTRAEA